MTQPTSSELLNYLSTICEPHQIKTDQPSLEHYGKDWTKADNIQARAVVLPNSTQQVSAILSYCNSQDIAVVLSGGRTGLAGGCVAQKNELIVSLEKLNKIHDIDKVGLTLTCDAGCITQDLQDKAREHGLFMPLDLAAKGSCHIGGNIATNAGGLNVIRYGMARNLVLGLEVVLANGEILDLNHKLMKNNSGYDLKQLFIGSEGTLGVITKVCLKLQPTPDETQVMFLAVSDIASIPKVLSQCSSTNLSLSAFEFLSTGCLQLVLKHFAAKRSPLSSEAPYYLLLEFDHAQSERAESFFESCFNDGIVCDGSISTNSSEKQDIWSLRELISECISTYKNVYKNDISVPVYALATFLTELESLISSKYDSVSSYIFGHIGDGNVHLNLTSADLEAEEFQEKIATAEVELLALLQKHQGSISAEHGIGLLKKKLLLDMLPDNQLNLMKQIKNALDPRNTLNPGKIFDIL